MGSRVTQVGRPVKLVAHTTHRDRDADHPGQQNTKRLGGDITMSKIQLSPYINFQGRACEAMEFYQSVLGGDLDLQTMDEQGQSKPAGPGDSIMYSRLDADGVLIIGVDGRPDFPA